MAFVRDTLKGLAYFLSGPVLRKSLESYCRLVTANSDNALVADDGSLVSVFRLEGCRSIKGSAELSKDVSELRLSLASQFGERGFTLQFWFGHLPEVGRADLENILAGTASVARNAELDVSDLLEERASRLPDKLSGERAYIVLWSRPALLSREESRSSAAVVTDELKQLPHAPTAQLPMPALPALLTRHNSIVESLQRETRRCGFDIELLDVREALSEIKGVLNPEFLAASNNWKAVLPGDHLRAKMPDTELQNKGKDFSHLLWPSLSSQIMSEGSTLLSDRIFEFGSKIYCGFDVVLGPEQVVNFNDLISRVLDQRRKISWRVSMLVDSGGFQGQTFKETYASLLTFTGRIMNGRIKRAFEAAREINGDGETIVRWRASFAAWCDRGEEKQLLSDIATLRQTVHGWGNTQTDMQVGDPVECIMSSTMGLNAASTAPVASAYLTDVFALAPLSRPSSPWRRGAILFRTKDGKLWPYNPGSSRQLGWVDIIVGQPGSGKSVLSNSMNLSIALSPQVGRSKTGASLLPRISIIDIGPSSQGLIQLIKDALPASRRHEAMHLRLQNREEYSVNPFDLNLCVQKPFPYELEFLVNLVCLCCTADDRESPYDGISALARAAINEAYEYYSEDMNPKRYSRTDSVDVDNALDALGYETDAQTTWWEVVKFLFDKDKHHEATLAQRFAVPVMADLVSMSNRETVKEPFREMRVESTSESVVVAFQRMVTAACRDFPILARPTRFSVADARIIAFDLEAVTSNTGAHAHRQSAVMYMLTRHTITSDFWLHEDDLDKVSIPANVRAYHLERVTNNKQMQKRLAYDEYHRTGNLAFFRKQNENDARVGRKTGVQQVYASQLIDDFDREVQELANNFFFCNVPSEGAIRSISENFNFSPTIQSVLRGLNGPIAGQGAPFVAMMKLKTGIYTQYLFNDIGPIESWALSTTQGDTALRSLIYEAFGPKMGRRVLAKRFPQGTASELIEVRKTEMEARGVVVDESAKENLIRQIADEIIRGFRDV
ncbi:hypothetical protein EHE22_26500 (plasmid) [Ochrobactrum pseudogrignonense]|uniref:Intracellular multiplication protein IcmB n=1 Tax=Brucella pseudogrignonensis TaxID=419475 RepID=A0A7Y3TAA7_9HYPH|nr:hypothetical protein [Brucella pseudogrignonensis]NNV23902.1 hypothetical protein [Brucella pseudogrignonensis]